MRAAAMLIVVLITGCASRSQATPQQRIHGAVDAMQEAIGKVIADPERARRAQGALTGITDELLAFEELAVRYRTRLLELNARSDATRAEFESLLGEYDAQRVKARHQLLTLHAELIADTTAEEWQALAPRERALLSVAIGT
jgi:molybdenum-dependent DNA-binding transcriptional regulator ModE